jgi:hypothetical protein
MSGISTLQNSCIYSLGPALSGQVSESLQSQITGMQNMQKHQVNQAIYIDSNVMISKTSAALQNVAIASQFCNTTVASLQTVEASLTDALNASMTLLNGTVSDANKASAADSIIDAIGMKHGAKSRDGQEGSVIKTLRQSGTGVSPFYTLTTSEGTPSSPDAAPPEAKDLATQGATLFFNGVGSVPADTFMGPQTIQFTGFSSSDCTTIDPSGATTVVAAAGTIDDIQFNLPIGDVVYSSEHLDLVTAPANKAINLYHPDDKGKYITFYTSPTVATGVTDEITALAAFKALFSGSINTGAVENTTPIFTPVSTAAAPAAPANTFPDPAITPPTFSGVEAGDIRVLSATLANPSKLAVQVGEQVFATSDLDNLNIGALAGTGNDLYLYLDGDKNNSQNTIKLRTVDVVAGGAMATTDAELVAALTAYLNGTFAVPAATSSEDGVFIHSGTPVPTGGLLPCNPSCFENVKAGTISVTSTSYAGIAAGDGTDVVIEVKVGDEIYSTDSAAGGGINTPGTPIVLYKGGDNTSTSKISIFPGPIANAAEQAGPPVVPGVGICDEQTLNDAVKAALSGSFMPFGQAPISTPFIFTPGSNYGAGYFTLKYDGVNMHFYDQFNDIVQSWPVSEEEILESVANDGGRLNLGDIGTLYTDSSYAGGAFEKKLITTASREFSTTVTVSGNDGARRIMIPNLTDQRTLYGISTTIDHERLVKEPGYQKEVKGMIEHALLKVKETIQYVSNINNSLAADERGQNASMSSLQSLKDVVSEADPIGTANAVFESSQAYNSMVNAMYIAATITAQETRSSLQIAQLAAAG